MALPSSALLSALPAGDPGQGGGGVRAVVEVPGVWRGASLDSSGMGRAGVEPSGHAALDAQLPGGGWPRGAMSEVLLPDRGLCEWPLVLPALARATARRAGQVVLVAPPHEPFVPVLHAAGLRAGRLCRVEPPADARDAAPAWACEQALRCRDVLAVLAWLPRARPDALRRLQLAAAQQGALLWVCSAPRGSGCRPRPRRCACGCGRRGRMNGARAAPTACGCTCSSAGARRCWSPSCCPRTARPWRPPWPRGAT
ncbi:translesion DNA synthesis-associated protein ImuA [Paracidovorax anthurii]|uniref:Protein ImuA n=1 Tax=Paracidovorax anthurii TaxID=78229 RepID=A0A328YL40_9BURK|nr:hypothetical protein AX018_10689 [Paracidovorax anthurii]